MSVQRSAFVIRAVISLCSREKFGAAGIFNGCRIYMKLVLWLVVFNLFIYRMLFYIEKN